VIESKASWFFHNFMLYLIMGSKNWRQVKTTIGNLLLDLGKLAFGSLILGSILRGGLDPFQTFVFGIAIAILLFVIGILIIAYNKE
jgi:hypothetical protein